MTTTAILELTKPAQGYANWHIPINANFDTLETKLVKAYQNVWVVGQITYFTSNAKYVTDHWERLSISYGATMFAQDNENKTIKQYYCASGSGTITWILISTIDSSGNITAVGTITATGNIIAANLTNVYNMGILAVVSDILKYSSDVASSSSSTTYVVIKTLTVPENYVTGSEFRVKFAIGTTFGSAVTMHGRIYKNDVALGIEREYINTGDDSFDTYSEDLAFEAGDTIQIYGKTNAGDCYIKEFRLYYDNEINAIWS